MVRAGGLAASRLARFATLAPVKIVLFADRPSARPQCPTGSSTTQSSTLRTRRRRGQDDREGDAHRVADDQLCPPARQQELHPRLSRRRAGPDHQGSPARAAAERSRQLLRESRARPARHARGREQSQDRHHQLPRVHAARAHRALEGWAPASARPHRRRTADSGNRRADAPARDARADGNEERSRVERRGASLLPREAGRRRGR